jgi:hypothetical protein
MTSRLLPIFLLLTQALPLCAMRQANPIVAPLEGFAHPAIARIWERDDGEVASGKAARPWMWGPGPFRTNYEPFDGLAQGNHLVQYFDKDRLEANDPKADQNSPWFVTSGLLVNEMMTGKAQVGENRTLNIGPARVSVVGDDPTAGPTYADFILPPYSDRKKDATGSTVGCWFMTRDPLNPRSRDLPAELNLRMVRYESTSGHNWAEPFWRYATNTFGDRWLQTLGYPITEPCGVTAVVSGKTQSVLVQLFERRVLTYNPANPPENQVEMGNVGRHYFNWRYANPREAALGSKYDVHIQIGPTPRRAISVQQSIQFTNTTGSPLNTAVFRAIWHHWDGVFTLKSATINGEVAKTRWLHGINLELATSKPVPVGGQVNIALSFDAQPRPVGGRTGYDRTNDILGLGDVLPTLVPWENGGWLYYPYSDLGDLGYYASSDYSVEVASNGSEYLVVGGTGGMPVNDRHGARWRFEAKGTRDAAYVVSPRFINPLQDASMTRQVGSVKMLAYFLPSHRADGQRQLQLTTPALAWFGKEIGPYPFDSYTVAEMGVPLERTDNYAQEYPMSYFIPTSWLSLGTTPGTWTWYTPVHEVAHQWFYSTIGNNQLADPWLDEALATYVTSEYVRLNYPDLYSISWASMTRSATAARPVSAGVFSGFANENQYSASIYDSGALMLDKVRRAMGDPDFYAALRDYYSTYQGKRATSADLQAMLQAHSKADLKPIFARYLAY